MIVFCLLVFTRQKCQLFYLKYQYDFGDFSNVSRVRRRKKVFKMCIIKINIYCMSGFNSYLDRNMNRDM